MGWRNESRRHSLAAHGIKTSNNIKTPLSIPNIKTVYRGGTPHGGFNEGYYFTDQQFSAGEYAQLYGNNDIYKAEIIMNHPIDFTLYENVHLLEEITGKKRPDIYPGKLTIEDRFKMVNYAKQNGYDSMIHKDTDAHNTNYITSYVVFDKNQIEKIKLI